MDDQHRNLNMNNKDHPVGRLTPTSDPFQQLSISCYVTLESELALTARVPPPPSAARTQ